jgi:hypothetical protein
MTSQRKFLRLGNNSMGAGVGVSRLLPGPSALLSVRPGRSGLRIGINAPQQGADIDFLVTVRAFHRPSNYPAVGISRVNFQSSPLPNNNTIIEHHEKVYNAGNQRLPEF